MSGNLQTSIPLCTFTHISHIYVNRSIAGALHVQIRWQRSQSDAQERIQELSR